MAGTKGEEAIVEGHEDKGGRERVNDDKDSDLAKRSKVEGNAAAGCRDLGTKLQSLTMTCDKGEEGEALKKKIDRLSGLLEGDLARLIKKDVEDVICYLDVDEIISLASKSEQAKDDEVFDEYGYLEGGVPFVPSCGKVLWLLKLMLQSGVEKLKEADLYILYQNFPKLPFAQLLFSACGSYSLIDEADENVLINKLCCILPWKLFTHIMYHKTRLPQFKRIEEEESNGDECTIQKKAAESCEICCGKSKHRGVYGYHCSFWDSIPRGLTVGPRHYVCCRDCDCLVSRKGFVNCWCGSRMWKAVPCSIRWKMN